MRLLAVLASALLFALRPVPADSGTFPGSWVTAGHAEHPRGDQPSAPGHLLGDEGYRTPPAGRRGASGAAWLTTGRAPFRGCSTIADGVFGGIIEVPPSH